MKPRVYEFQLGQPSGQALEWLIGECKKRHAKSPVFFDALINAFTEELQLRTHKQTRHANLRVPWLMGDPGGYREAVTFVCFCQVVANEHQRIILRNLLGVLQEILFDMTDQKIAMEQELAEPRVH